MAKATVQRIKQEGWRADQFGGGFAAPADFDAYLQSALDEAGRWAEHLFGVIAYAAVVDGTYIHDCLVRAEVCATACTLWKRRAAFLDSGASKDLQSPAYLDRREYLAHAATAWDCAVRNIGEAMGLIGLEPPTLGDWSAFAPGTVETGRFPSLANGVLAHG